MEIAKSSHGRYGEMKWRQQDFLHHLHERKQHDKNWTLRNMIRKRNRFHWNKVRSENVFSLSFSLVFYKSFFTLQYHIHSHNHIERYIRDMKCQFFSLLSHFFSSHKLLFFCSSLFWLFDKDDGYDEKRERKKSSKNNHVFYPSKISFYACTSKKIYLKATTIERKENFSFHLYCNIALNRVHVEHILQLFYSFLFLALNDDKQKKKKK